LCSVVVVRGGCNGLEAEVQCGDDSVVEDVADVGLGGEEAEGCGVVLRGRGLDGCDAEVLVALGESGASGEEMGFGVAWDGGVAIEDEVAVGSYAGGVDLGYGGGGKKREKESGEARDASAEQTGASRWGSWL
jgi:hypothetical protein